MADERRMLALPVEMRAAADDAPTMIEGYGAVFDQETIIGDYFREKFAPGAFADSFRNDDILVAFNHNPDCLLGRKANGTATFEEDARGGMYRVQMNPKDPDAMCVMAKVERRDVTGSSLVFRVENDADEEWIRDDKAKLPLRIIKRATVIEMGPVAMPYYPETTAAARSRAETFRAADEARAAEAQAAEDARQEAARQVAVADADRTRRLRLAQAGR